jgi:hypothetical protein
MTRFGTLIGEGIVFVLINEDGSTSTILKLSANSEGVEFTLFDGQDRRRFEMTVSDDGLPALRIFGGDDRVRDGLAVVEEFLKRPRN